MAVDTREKRMAMIGFGGGQNWDTLFEADSTVNADDRYHLLDLYSGFGSADGGMPVGDAANTGISNLSNITDIN